MATRLFIFIRNTTAYTVFYTINVGHTGTLPAAYGNVRSVTVLFNIAYSG